MSEETVEQKAAELGWVPQEQWKGDPEKWRPAEEFVERGEKILPILKKELEKTKSELKIALSLNQQEIERIKQESYERAKSEYLAKMRIIDQREAEAIKAQDGEAVVEARKVRESMKPPEPPKQSPKIDVVFEDWRSKNPWYQADPELTDAADIISHKIVAERGGKVSDAERPELLKEMERRVKATHPHKFSNPKREEPGVVEGGNQQSTPAKKNGKTFDSLPESAKGQYAKLAEKFKAKGRTFTKEQYAQAYYEQQ